MTVMQKQISLFFRIMCQKINIQMLSQVKIMILQQERRKQCDFILKIFVFIFPKGAEVDDKEEEDYFVQLRVERKVQDDAIARVR